jgi:hypothetical protein
VDYIYELGLEVEIDGVHASILPEAAGPLAVIDPVTVFGWLHDVAGDAPPMWKTGCGWRVEALAI